MLENTESLLPLPRRRPDGSQGGQIQVLCVGFADESLDELEMLLTTLGVEPRGRVPILSKRISPATYVGRGKVDEIRARLKGDAVAALPGVPGVTGLADAPNVIDAVIFDVELSPNQLRNLEKELGCAILDRPGVIIEIFSRHARTNESKTQVSLARLQYLLPRLSHFWTHFERQRGGGTAARGMGEKQIEVDRRLVKRRMSVLRERLVSIEKERHVQRAGRKDILKVALVGYTNAGKSTLLNALTQSHVRAEDKLFATLDSSVRSLDPNSHPPIVAIDTVGFISRLPPSLVASFRSTLEELEEADLLLHVVDASSSQAKEQLQVTEGVLKDLGVDETPRITVLNKADRIGGTPAARNGARLIAPGAILVSALNTDDVRKLRDTVLEHFRAKMEVWEILLPYSESKLEAQLYRYGAIEVNRHLEKGTFYRLRMEGGRARKLGLTKFRT